MLSNKTKPEKSNAPKDPDAPKRPVPAFFLFCSKERAEVQKELSSCNGAEVTKELGKRWALLDPEAKRVFEEASKRDKERYEEDMKSYKPSENFLKRKAEYETKAKLQNPLVAKQPTNPVEDYFTYLLLNWRQVIIIVLRSQQDVYFISPPAIISITGKPTVKLLHTRCILPIRDSLEDRLKKRYSDAQSCYFKPGLCLGLESLAGSGKHQSKNLCRKQQQCKERWQGEGCEGPVGAQEATICLLPLLQRQAS